MEKDLLRCVSLEKWYNALIKRFKTRTPRALELLQKERYTSVPRSLPLARRPILSSQQDEYVNRPQPLLLETEKGSPSRPTQKPSTNQRKLDDKEDN